MAFTVRRYPVRDDCKYLCMIMPTGSLDFPQGDLHGLGFCLRMSVEEFVDSLVGCNKGQSIGEFKAFLA